MAIFTKISNYLKRLFALGRRTREDEAEQKRLGYRIDLEHMGGESYFTYSENELKVSVMVRFTVWNDVTIYLHSLDRWDAPAHEDIMPPDQERVLDRVIKYASCWGDITLDQTPLLGPEDIKAHLRAEGIPFKELENGVIEYAGKYESRVRKR